MNILILKGFKNNFSREENSVSLQISTDLFINDYLKKAIKKIDKIYEIISKLTEKHNEITFYNTFRLRYIKKK